LFDPNQPNRAFDAAWLAVKGRVLTLSQLSAYMAVPRRQLYRVMTKYASFPVFKRGRRWCAQVDAVREWLLQDFDKEMVQQGKKDRRQGARLSSHKGDGWEENT